MYPRLLVFFCILIIGTKTAYSQIEEAVQFYPNGSKKEVNYLSGELKKIEKRFYKQDGSLIGVFNYDPVTEELNGRFSDGVNSGSFNQGKLNCLDCEAMYQAGTLLKGKFINGRPEGIIEVYEVSNTEFETHDKIPLVNMLRILNGNIVKGKRSILKYKNGVLHGSQIVNDKSRLFYEAGVLKGIITQNATNSISQDSIMSTAKIWKFENKFYKNYGWIRGFYFNDFVEPWNFKIGGVYDENDEDRNTNSFMISNGYNPRNYFLGSDSSFLLIKDTSDSEFDYILEYSGYNDQLIYNVNGIQPSVLNFAYKSQYNYPANFLDDVWGALLFGAYKHMFLNLIEKKTIVVSITDAYLDLKTIHSLIDKDFTKKGPYSFDTKLIVYQQAKKINSGEFVSSYPYFLRAVQSTFGLELKKDIFDERYIKISKLYPILKKIQQEKLTALERIYFNFNNIKEGESRFYDVLSIANDSIVVQLNFASDSLTARKVRRLIEIQKFINLYPAKEVEAFVSSKSVSFGRRDRLMKSDDIGVKVEEIFNMIIDFFKNENILGLKEISDDYLFEIGDERYFNKFPIYTKDNMIARFHLLEITNYEDLYTLNDEEYQNWRSQYIVKARLLRENILNQLK